MNSPNPVPALTGAIPWYKSPQQIGLITTAVSGLIAAFPKVGQFFGWSSPSDAASAVTAIFASIAIAAPIIGGFVRAHSKTQPLTFTQAAANAHPVTLATEQTHAAMVAAGIPTVAVTAAKIEAKDATK